MSIVSQIDPTRTTTTRRRFAGATAARFRRVSQRLRELIERDDAFGLRAVPTAGAGPLTYRWAGLATAGKVRAFRTWLRGQLAAMLLPSPLPGTFWTDPFIAAAYRRGILNAYAQARPDVSAGAGPAAERYAGGLDQFVRDMTASPAAVARIRQLQDRAADGVEDVVGTLFARLGRAVADGLAGGSPPTELVAALVKVVRTMTARGITLAQTETTHAHAEAQLDAYERMGHDQVRIRPEKLAPGEAGRRLQPTANRKAAGLRAEVVCLPGACEICEAKADRVYSIRYARGLIPFHTNCKCFWLYVPAPRAGLRRSRVAD